MDTSTIDHNYSTTYCWYPDSETGHYCNDYNDDTKLNRKTASGTAASKTEHGTDQSTSSEVQ
jgi:hypothetical protein